MKIAIINDTRPTHHYGCRLVMENLMKIEVVMILMRRVMKAILEVRADQVLDVVILNIPMKKIVQNLDVTILIILMMNSYVS